MTVTPSPGVHPPTAADQAIDCFGLATRLAQGTSAADVLRVLAGAAVDLTAAKGAIAVQGATSTTVGISREASSGIAALLAAPGLFETLYAGGLMHISNTDGRAATDFLAAAGCGPEAIVAPIMGTEDHDAALVVVGSGLAVDVDGPAIESLCHLAGAVLDRIAEQRRLEHRVGTDSSTGLLSRAGFVAASSDAPDAVRAIVVVHLAGTAAVASSFGQSAADWLLRSVATGLGDACRASLVGRVGPTDLAFAVGGEARAAADQVLAAATQPMRIGRRTVALDPHVGYSAYQGGSLRALLHQAETARHHAVASAQPIVGHSRAITDAVHGRLALAAALRDGIANRELVVRYQPQCDAGGRVIAAEALVRWARADGEVSPADFLPLAEETGLIASIDLFVLRTSCEQIATWRQGGVHLRVAVNLSARTLSRPDIASEVLAIVRAAGVDPGAVEIEITETLAGSEVGWIDALTSLRNTGITVAIDDFGTGHSSLARLHCLPVDRLKIDQSFVWDLDGAGAAVVRAVISLGHALDLRVIAEGVETPQQRDGLCALGCDELQGYLFGRPSSAEDVMSLAVAAASS